VSLLSTTDCCACLLLGICVYIAKLIIYQSSPGQYLEFSSAVVDEGKAHAIGFHYALSAVVEEGKANAIGFHHNEEALRSSVPL
jgi:hypothetical protein